MGFFRALCSTWNNPKRNLLRGPERGQDMKGLRRSAGDGDAAPRHVPLPETLDRTPSGRSACIGWGYRHPTAGHSLCSRGEGSLLERYPGGGSHVA